MTKPIEMVQFTIHTSGKGVGDTWNLQSILDREVECFDTTDLQDNLDIGQCLNNFDHALTSDGKGADVWEANYCEAPVDGSYEDFLQWCKDNDYIDDYAVEYYALY